ncbi:ABC transporter substrate-binding protein [Sporosarcina sp. SG10008]|uniref:ABC transporter substrate-binding protein n=3 Tax=Caryophanaceae TaxID=186818 RepID=UPI0037DD92D2
MKKVKFGPLALIVIVSLSVILGACTSSGLDDESTKVNAKKILVYGHSGNSTSLDPAHMKEGDSTHVTVNLYETLVNLDEQGTTVVPGLAEKWDSSEDGLTYTFQLRKDVKFHDGTDFNADAVIKNFERWTNGDAEEFPFYSSVFNGFKGDDSRIIESVATDGDDTVTIKLNNPQASFLKNLTMSPFSIVSPNVFEQSDEEFESDPIGTGPFQYFEGKQNEAIVVVKFQEYWQESLPKLEKIIFKSIPDNTARLNALIAGDIDLADSINPEDRMEVDDDADLQFFERPFMENIYEDAPSIFAADSTPLFGATKYMMNYLPQVTGFDVLSKVEFELPAEEEEE